MTKIILISHGMLAEGMANSIQMIAGKIDNLGWLSLHPGEEPETLYRQLEQQIQHAPEFTYILLTDIPGGSVNTALSKLCALPHVFLVSGMNLGLALNISQAPTIYLRLGSKVCALYYHSHMPSCLCTSTICPTPVGQQEVQEQETFGG